MATRSNITLARAVQIAMDWHGGQQSALYQFGSSHDYHMSNHLLYLEEVIQNIHRPETSLKPFTIAKKQIFALNALKHFFIAQGEKRGITTVWIEDEYKIVPFPTIKESNDYIKKPLRIQ